MRLFGEIFCLSIFLLGAIFVSGCGDLKRMTSAVPKPTRDECVKLSITKLIESTPQLSEIPVLVRSATNGDIALHIAASNKHPLQTSTIRAIQKGLTLLEVKKADPSISFLIDFEKRLQQTPSVKSIRWSTDDPCSPGFVCQTTGSSEKSAGSDEVEAMCREYE